MIIIKQIITKNSEILFIVLSLSFVLISPFLFSGSFFLFFALVFASIQSQSNFFKVNHMSHLAIQELPVVVSDLT